MGVGETHKEQTIFFMTDCLKIVCYACWSQNCGRFERFENENFLGSLRAYSGPESLLEPPHPYPDRPQTRTATPRAIQSLLEPPHPAGVRGPGWGQVV